MSWYVSINYFINFLVTNQRRSEDYTGMQRGQARFITYYWSGYWFLALRRHCSVGIRCVYTSTFREIPKRFYRKKIVKWWMFALFVERKLRFWVDTSFCLFTGCQKQPSNHDSGRITVWWTWMPPGSNWFIFINYSFTDSLKNSPLSSCG
jgi:hypothetical protein